MEAYQLVGREDIVANMSSAQEPASPKGKDASIGGEKLPGPIQAAVYSKTPMTKPQLRTPMPGGKRAINL